MGGEGEREGVMVGKGMLEERGNKWREEREAISTEKIISEV